MSGQGIEQGLVRQRTEGESYCYSPILETKQEIRLCTLLPGRFSSEIRIILQITPLNKDSTLSYEALSYTWGSASNLVDILVGETGIRTVAVTQNLAEALLYEDRPRILWIDAVCVNQQDDSERSQQVQRMGDLFSCATRVLIWLGPQLLDTSIAIECLNIISSKVSVDWRRQSLRATSEEVHWADTSRSLPFNIAQCLAIEQFIQSPWFERLWIWQEVHLASRDPLVLCGTLSISWRVLVEGVTCMRYKAASIHMSDNLCERYKAVYELCRQAKYSNFRDLIYRTNKSKYSNQRDRVYAILSLLSDHDRQGGPKVDYSKSPSQVYTDTSLCYMEFWRSLNLLRDVEARAQDLPSWVPDLRVPRKTYPMKGLMLAAGSSEMKFVAPDGLKFRSRVFR